ncbi:MAG TPA: aminoacyl--tRNA ligase-related protein [Candidatus Paceibacterota bacterium]|nr:aminoacyl--tRNA ligase-related protein [Candidatus Paceibacterota bacterium]
MRQSKLFTKTRKTAPKDEVAKNAQLLIRAGYIHKEMAGVYAYLPLGLRVVEKIKEIVRQEMNAVGGQEIIMTALQRKELWEKTDRWDDEKVDVWFKSALKSGGEVGFGWSHEEPITDMMKNYIASYRDLPISVYQFQTKLRNELRAKSGIMRGREFVMKDMYTYTSDPEAHKKIYNAAIDAYFRVFERVGLGERTYLTYASGGAFTDFSHEFQTLCDAGEDTIYVCDVSETNIDGVDPIYLNKNKHQIAINKEIVDSNELSKGLFLKTGFNRDAANEYRSIEVGNIFDFGGKKSEQLDLYFKNEVGESIPVHLGSYGIGITRLMGAVVEVLSDDKGIVWPEEIAPYQVHLVSISGGNDDVIQEANRVYDLLQESGIEILYDDRDARAGEKFADADLIGIPVRLVISEKTMSEGGLERIDRKTGSITFVSDNELVDSLKK